MSKREKIEKYISERNLNREILTKLKELGIVKCTHSHNSEALQIQFKSIDPRSTITGIKYRFCPTATIHGEEKKTLNKKGSNFNGTWLYLSFEEDKPNLIVEGEIDFLSLSTEVFEYYNVIAFAGGNQLLTTIKSVREISGKDIIILNDIDEAGKKEIDGILNCDICIDNIFIATSLLGHEDKDINDMCMRLQKYITLEEIENNKQIMERKEISLQDYINQSDPILQYQLEYFLPGSYDVGILKEVFNPFIGDDWRFIITSIESTFDSEGNIDLNTYNGITIHCKGVGPVNISITSRDITNPVKFKEKISIIPFINLNDLKPEILKRLMDSIKLYADKLAHYKLVSHIKKYKALGFQKDGDIIRFSNGELNLLDGIFTTGINKSFIKEGLEFKFTEPKQETFPDLLYNSLSEYLVDEYDIFCIAGYLFATSQLVKIRSHLGNFPLLSLEGQRGLGKSFALNIISAIVGFSGKETDIIDVSSSTPAGIKYNIGSCMYLTILNEYNQKVGKEKNVDDILRANYDGSSIQQGNVDGKNKIIDSYPNSSAIIYAGMSSCKDESVLTRTIVLRFTKASRKTISSEDRDSVIQKGNMAFMSFLKTSHNIDIPLLVEKTLLFLKENNIKFSNDRYRNTYIVISLYRMYIDRQDMILKNYKQFTDSCDSVIEENSIIEDVAEDIISNVDNYCSMIRNLGKEQEVPAVFVDFKGNLILNFREIKNIYCRRSKGLNNEIHNTELYSYFGIDGRVKAHYGYTNYPNRHKGKNSIISDEKVNQSERLSQIREVIIQKMIYDLDQSQVKNVHPDTEKFLEKFSIK